MKKYKVQVKFEFDDEVVVLANDPAEANEVAVRTLGSSYLVWNADTSDYLDWSDVYGYDPEEVQ